MEVNVEKAKMRQSLHFFKPLQHFQYHFVLLKYQFVYEQNLS
jgi:hypothetical protein